MSRLFCGSLLTILVFAIAVQAGEKRKRRSQRAKKTVNVGTPAPDFKIKDSEGNEINLAELTAKGLCWYG